jgi:hypothetical protein
MREEGRIREGGLLNKDDSVVEAPDEFTGDHGREDAIDVLDILLLYGDPPLVDVVMVPLFEEVMAPLMDGRRCFVVPEVSIGSTLVEPFHLGRPLSVGSDS